MQNKYTVRIPHRPRKSYAKIPQPWHKRIAIALKILEIDPFIGITMTGDMADKRKVVIWPYRIIYRIRQKQKVIEILEIEHRQNTSYR